MFSIHIHPHTETHVPTEMHTGSAGEHSTSVHAPTPHAPASASSALAFSAAGESGLHSGLLSHLGNKPSTFNPTSVKLPGDANSYVIKDTSNTRTPQPLYAKSDIGSLKQTSKMGVYDGNGGVRLDNGLPGGGQDSSKHQHSDNQAYMSSYNPQGEPFSSRHSSSARDNASSSAPHSFSTKSAWDTSGTTGASAPALPPRNPVASSSSTQPIYSNVPSTTGASAPPLPPRNPVPSSSSTRPDHSNVSGKGPLPDSRYLKESGDGKSKLWVIRDGQGGTKPADSSIDKYGRPAHVYLLGDRRGKGEWTGPSNSVLAPRKKN
jgi:hypothetical protein